jgi:molybdopterin converting factor small subunit
MRVKVKALGWIERALKKSEQDFEFDGKSVSDFFVALKRDFGVEADMSRLVVLVNGVGVQDASYILKEGDTLTLLPIMSGG